VELMPAPALPARLAVTVKKRQLLPKHAHRDIIVFQVQRFLNHAPLEHMVAALVLQ
jgi:hypothetical protein